MEKYFVIATHNLAKRQEITQLLAHYHADGQQELSMVDHLTFPVEGTTSYEENAMQKALFVSRHLPEQNVIADDSGLELLAFPGKFGIETARQLRPYYTSKSVMNNAIIKLVKGHDRRFIMKTVIAWAKNGQLVKIVHGELRGTIAESQRGRNGDGFDRILIPQGTRQTLAEMSLDQWRYYNHRSRAIQALLNEKSDDVDHDID